MQPNEATVFIVDDLGEHCHRVENLLRTRGLKQEQFASAEQFLATYVPPRSGCVLIGSGLNGMSGVQLQRQLADLDAALPVIVMSTGLDVRTAVQALKSGVYSVIEMPCDPEEFFETVADALRYNASVQSARQQKRALQARFAALDSREREVLELVLDGRPNKAIVRRLDISGRTLNRIRASILQKTECSSLVKLAHLLATEV